MKNYTMFAGDESTGYIPKVYRSFAKLMKNSDTLVTWMDGDSDRIYVGVPNELVNDFTFLFADMFYRTGEGYNE